MNESLLGPYKLANEPPVEPLPVGFVGRVMTPQEWADHQYREEMIIKSNALLDENGISRNMVDKMIAVVAEGLATGSTDMRSLLYCAYREARIIQKNCEVPP